MLSIIASVVSIILNVEAGNGFGEGLSTSSMILTRIKLMPLIFISIIFRCTSFVIMVTFIRGYSILPMTMIWLFAHLAFQHVVSSTPFFGNIRTFFKGLYSVPAEVMQVTVGPILLPSNIYYWHQDSITEEDKADLIYKRKRLFFLDSVLAFLFHGVTLLTITLLWEHTTLLNDNLSACTFDFIRNNVPLFCDCVLFLGFFHCLTSFLYLKC